MSPELRTWLQGWIGVFAVVGLIGGFILERLKHPWAKWFWALAAVCGVAWLALEATTPSTEPASTR